MLDKVKSFCMPEKSKTGIIYQNECELLKMIAVPYFGVYSFNYTFFIPIQVVHTKILTDEIYNNYPQALQTSLHNFVNKFNTEIDYFLVTLDGSFLYSKYSHLFKENNMFRINLVPHPYIFYDIKQLGKDHKTVSFNCLYTTEDFNSGYLREADEYENLKINPENIIDDMNKKEIILHKSEDNCPAISPNNCSFLLNMKNNFFSLYVATAVTYGNKIVKLMIGQYNFILNNEFILFKPLFDNFTNFNEENISDFILNLYISKSNFSNAIYRLFYVLSKKIKNLETLKKSLIEMFDIFYSKTNGEFLVNSELDFGEFYYGDFLTNIWKWFNTPRIPLFSEEILCSDMQFSLSLTQKFIKKIINLYDNFLKSYFIFIKEYNNNYYKIDEKEIKELSLQKLESIYSLY